MQVGSVSQGTFHRPMATQHKFCVGTTLASAIALLCTSCSLAGGPPQSLRFDRKLQTLATLINRTAQALRQ